MGFYGNITNTSKTQFQFDKIYPNRKAMDEQVDIDGIFIGRYVLVDYNEIYSPGDEDISSYERNYKIDIQEYKNGKGYDSTAWQKVFIDGKEKYVMIAELNSVVPTLDIAIDPPSEIPLKPHFDADTTNVYYKIHLQPSWGFRVKEAKENDKSDEKTQDNKKLSIYYNKDGFNKDVPSKDLSTINEITLTTAKSGNKYNVDHDSHTQTEQDDIQELSIKLPAIGNMISDVWDLVYGPNRDGIGDDNLVGIKNSTQEARENAIEVTTIANEATNKANESSELINQYINGPEDADQGIPKGGLKQLIVDTNNSKSQADQASANAIEATKNANDAASVVTTATTNAIDATNRAVSAAIRAENAADAASGEFDNYLNDNGYVNVSNVEDRLSGILTPIRTGISNNSNEIDTIKNTNIPEINQSIDTIKNTDIPKINQSIDTIKNTNIPELNQSIEDLKSSVGDGKFVKISGDTMTGPLTLQDKLILSDVSKYSYGYELPEQGIEGQVYFQVAYNDNQDIIELIDNIQKKLDELSERLSYLENE